MDYQCRMEAIECDIRRGYQQPLQDLNKKIVALELELMDARNSNRKLDSARHSAMEEERMEMDNLKSEDGTDLFGLYHESFNPLPLHVDSGFQPEEIIYKQALTPFTSGQTVVFKTKWYGRSTSFTVDSEELKFKPKTDQNDRSDKHIVVDGKSFDKNIHQKYLSHIDIENLRGMEIEMIYEWKVGETFIMDRTYIHCSSSNLEKRKLGLTTFTKK
jgi:hypothetical protein